MFGVKQIDSFEGLVQDAEKIGAERAELRQQIEANRVTLAAAEAAVVDASRRVAEEEYAAAQIPDGLAVASKTALAAVSDAKLRARSVHLRIQGLESKLAAVEQRFASASAGLKSYIDQFVAGKIAALKGEFDDAIEALIRLIFRGYPLCAHRGDGSPRFFKARFVGLLAEGRVFNPVTEHGAAMNGSRLGHLRDGRWLSFDKYWRDDPEAEKLDCAIRGMKDRVAAITGTPADDGEQPAE